MNRHFTDARYYFRRGFEHLYAGIDEETEPLRHQLMERFGREPEAEEEVGPQTRRERVEYEARRAATRSREAAGKVRRRVGRTSS
ncbi:hypothetical protein GJR96_08480 [Haloferax sp. MBLA0076]|uniref:Uncharacterized protein n=1 Tax=Haloferax litoreum TaxID=2666140 RepID=A0A6A8GJX2_9EURY|nr:MULTISPECIES: hypothetical protein [Haloferax]KAB1193477.1 hypothetical protein Hfx1148_08470 [Haloferax sp. CBA1148]MRX21990.1 hypothetical protein [Haloferax litoreum]